MAHSALSRLFLVAIYVILPSNMGEKQTIFRNTRSYVENAKKRYCGQGKRWRNSTMISAWWLFLIIPACVTLGLWIAALMAAGRGD